MRAVIGIVLDSGELAGRAQGDGQQGEEQAGSHAGFQHAAPAKAQPFGGSPESTDDRLRRVVGILRGALQGGIFLRRDGGFERRADVLPLRPERVLAGAAETVLGEFRSTKAGEAQQLRLLVRGWRAARLLQHLRQADRGDVVARPRGPATGKLAVTGEMEVAAARNRIGRRRRRVVVVIRIVGLVRVRDGLQGVMGPTRQSGVVEQAEREFAGVGRHGGLLVVVGLRAAARTRPREGGRAGRHGLIGRG